MKDIAEPLRYVFEWYNFVVSEVGEAKKYIKSLEASVTSLSDELIECRQCVQEGREYVEKLKSRLAATEADVEHFRNQAFRALAMAVNPPVILRTDNEEVARKLDIAQARIRVLEGENTHLQAEVDWIYRRRW